MRAAVLACLLSIPSALAQNLPTFTYSTPGISLAAIATDSLGNTYLTGTGAIAPTPGAFQTQPSAGTCFDGSGGFGTPYLGPCATAFIVKLDSTGAVVFATYLGGNGSTKASAITVDPQGNVYVAGLTSPNVDGANTFPVTPGAAFTNLTGTAFVAKLNPFGARLVYATFLPAISTLAGLAVDPQGNAYIAGTATFENRFPTTPGAFQTAPKSSGNQSPGIVARLNASGSALAYATYITGSGSPAGSDILNAIAVDAAGNAFITGFTLSTDFPVTPGAFLTTSPGQPSVFVTKLNPQGTGLVYSTYLGPGTGEAVKLDAQGTAFVTGTATPANFPITPGEASTGAGFLTRLSADGASLIYSTGLPTPVSPLDNIVMGLDVDSAGNAVIAGSISSSGLPAGAGAFEPEYTAANAGVYIQRFTPAGQLSASTYLNEIPFFEAFALEPNGSVVVAGAASQVTSVTNFFISLTAINAASYAPNAIAPGEIVSLLGYGIGPATGVSATGASLPTELAGVQVSFNGVPAPLLYVQSHVINVQVPWELTGASATMQVSYPGVPSTATPVAVVPSLPGIFSVNNSDGTANSPANPAAPGTLVTIYGTGGGPTAPAAITGAFWPLTTLASLTLPVTVTVGAENAAVLYAGASPLSSSGVFQINVRLPATPASPLVLTIGGVSSAPVAIAIQ